MNVLNNIWIALSTPNEQLISILTLPFTFIEAILIIHLFTTLLNINTSTKSKKIYTIIIVCLSLFNMHLVASPINIFINYFMMIILAYLILKINMFQSFLAILISIIIFALIGTLILNPYLTILNITSSDLNTIAIYKYGYLILMYSIIWIISIIIKNKKIQINLIEDLELKNKNIILANLIIGLLTLSIQLIITIYYTDKLPIIITFLSFLSLLSYFSISIYSLTRIMKLTLTTRKLESAEEYNNTLRILHDNVRAFKHDFDNIVTTIGGFIRTNDMEGLKQYYLELEDDCQRVNNLYILNPEIVNNDGIYNLITKKYYEADSKDIKMNITFLLDLAELNMKIYEFARILGILLDNAIEASAECEEKIINIYFRNEDTNHRQIICIENTYKDLNINTEKIFEKGYSSKSEHTGLGLWEVRKIISKNTNLNLFTTKNKKFFIQQLEIYY